MGIGIPTTRGDLKRAEIFEVDEQRDRVIGGNSVPCMFNPFEYTVTKSNSFKEPDATNSKNAPKAEFSKGGAQTLQLSLFFDTYETDKDVRDETNKLWDFMAVKAKPNKRPMKRTARLWWPLPGVPFTLLLTSPT